MKGDFSRNTFNPQNRYSSVRMQQGRVQLDADWNEQMDIIEYRHRIQANDFIGVTGTPANAVGFAISVSSDGSGTNNNLLINAGRYYIEGLLCEKFEHELFTEQTDLPGISLPTDDGIYLAYLEAWQHSLNAVENPSLLEVALNGADTTTRIKTLAQVKLINVKDNQPPADPNAYLNTQFDTLKKGTLTAKLDPSYTNLQNQLYRVEIHQSGDEKTATFKWSRNNAALSARIANIQLGSATLITLDRMTQLNQLNLVNDQYLEIITEEQQLRNELGILVKLTAISDYQLTVTEWPANITDTSALTNSILRCWDMKTGAILIQPNVPIAIEDGLQIHFATGSYQCGDYWMIPTRANDQLAWPSDQNNNPVPQSPLGVNRYYTPLAILNRLNGQWKVLTDCRYIFSSLAELQHSKVITVDPNAPDGSLAIDDQGDIKIKKNLATDAIKRIAPFYVRGTGSNRKTDDNYTLIKIGNQVIVDSRTEPNLPQPPQGLYLCIINKADYSSIVKRYDTYLDSHANTADTEALATALNAMTSQQIGILTSIDAWEAYLANVDANLINALQRLGLYRAAAIKSNQPTIRRPYAAIFVPSDPSGNSAQAIEILQSSAANAPYAELSGWLVEGSFVTSGSSTPNALSYYVGVPPAVVVDENNVTTINTLNVNNIVSSGAFSVTPAPNKIPIADSTGHLNSAWLGSSTALSTSITPAPNKIPMADSSGLIDSNWLSNRWLPPLSNMHTVRQDFCAVLMGDEIYMLGGTSGGTMIKTIDVYNIKTHTWTTGKGQINPRKSFAAAAVNGKIYLIGGSSDNIGTYRNDIEVYDPQSGANQLPIQNNDNLARTTFSATAFGNKIYLIGGYFSNGYSNWIHIYDVLKNTIDGAPVTLSYKRCDHCSVLLDGKICIIGGWGGSQDDDTSKHIDIFDPYTNQIKPYQINARPSGSYTRRYFGATVVNNKLYAVGGFDGSKNISEVEIFNPLNNELGTVVTSLPDQRLRTHFAAVGSVVDNRIYLFGGEHSEVDVYICAT